MKFDASSADPLPFRRSLLPFKAVLSMEELSIKVKPCLVEICLIISLTCFVLEGTSTSCLSVIPDKPIFDRGNFACTLAARFSLGRLFIPAWIITCDGSDSRLIESISFEISSAD